MRHVTLVCGPPCAGKSTLIARQRHPADLVADFDEVASGLGSRGKWMQSRQVRDATELEMVRLWDEVAAMENGVAWVIRCAPEPQQRSSLAERIRADRVVVLLPPLGVLLGRARLRPLAAETRSAIMRRMDRYAPRLGDDLIRG